ncbi:hypothetical protein P5673_010930 [Acropora cervicornis]|uniref:Uncharacterized protein n=1 Tax=Acropora cervicornis TaxID=6130 RepID=A0AAD9QQZ0_ACRCE|nr:hypothetical protein P5673_010930 [Acropora cervicornis]
MVATLSTSKATGLEDLSSYFLEIAASSISPSLTAVFNLSISSGVFPDLCKTAKLLLDSQFGVRSSRSCELAIANLSHNILTNMDNKLF